MQKAEDGDLKDEDITKAKLIITRVMRMTTTEMPMNNEMANSAANIMMSQWQPTKEDELITRDTVKFKF